MGCVQRSRIGGIEMNYSKEACEGWLGIGDMVLVSLKSKPAETTYHELGFVDWMEDILTLTHNIGEESPRRYAVFDWNEIDNIQILGTVN